MPWRSREPATPPDHFTSSSCHEKRPILDRGRSKRPAAAEPLQEVLMPCPDAHLSQSAESSRGVPPKALREILLAPPRDKTTSSSASQKNAPSSRGFVPNAPRVIQDPRAPLHSSSPSPLQHHGILQRGPSKRAPLESPGTSLRQEHLILSKSRKATSLRGVAPQRQCRERLQLFR